MALFASALVLLVAAQAALSSPCGNSHVNRENLTLALVRAPPPNWPLPITNYDYTGITFNVSESVDAGIALIKKAGAEGANAIQFPELWFPGFPKAADNPKFNFTRDHLPSYVENTITVGDDQWNRLVAATREAGIYSQINFAEKDGDHMYMAQSLLSPAGDILHHRRKLRPSGGERWMFSDGTMDGLKVVQTAFGRWGMLECGEHTYPSVLWSMHAQKEHLHFAPFPYLADIGDKASLWWENEEVEFGTVSDYSVGSFAYSATAAVGVSFVTDPTGLRVAHAPATLDFDEFPILYYSYNTSGFNDSITYDVNGQWSWATLNQIRDNYPEYIPKEEGTLIKPRKTSLEWLKTGALRIGNGQPPLVQP